MARRNAGENDAVLMASTREDELRSERIEREATAWFIRMRSADSRPADREAFRTWRVADPEHGRAFAEVEALWRDLDAPAAAAARRVRHAPSAPARRGFGRMTMAAAVAAACLAVVIWRDPGLVARARADHAAPPGAGLTVSLKDGSSLYLDGDSAVTEDFDNGRRDVTVLRGRVWFDVAPDPARPFLVHARTLDVRVTGTAFGVDRERDLVTVEHGAVSVAEGDDHLRLSAGQQVEGRDGRLAAPETVDPSTALAWRRGLVVLDAAPLDDVFREVARMAGGRIIAPQADVRAMTLSGVFRADDPEALVEAMRRGLGLRTFSAPGLATLVYR